LKWRDKSLDIREGKEGVSLQGTKYASEYLSQSSEGENG
jgi:hypothetical protein